MFFYLIEKTTKKWTNIIFYYKLLTWFQKKKGNAVIEMEKVIEVTFIVSACSSPADLFDFLLLRRYESNVQEQQNYPMHLYYNMGINMNYCN